MPVRIEIEGIDPIVMSLRQFQQQVARYWASAGKEVGAEVMGTEGLQKYPPATEANAPGRISIRTHRPMGYYQRGKGWFYPVMSTGPGTRRGNKAFREAYNIVGYRMSNRTSERYGTQFYVQSSGMVTEIGNRASYAKWLADEKLQASIPASRGWRKLIDVANEKVERIVQIYNGWMQQMIDELGLGE